MTGSVSRNGEHWVVSALKRWERPLLRYACRLVGDADLARDLVQEGFLRLCRQDRAQVEARLPAWLYAVVRNLAIDRQRKEGRMHGSDGVDLAARAGAAVAPLERLAAAEQESRLLAAIEELPARQREVVHLKFARGLRYREIAEVTGTSVGNVGFVLHTALNRLRALLDGGAATPQRARSGS